MRSALRSKRANAVSVCGKILPAGKTKTFPLSAIGPRERQLEARGKISIRKSNTRGSVQITCLLKG